MKLVIFGASGMIGSRIFNEAVRRGHQVTVSVRETSHFRSSNSQVRIVKGDVLNPASVVAAAEGQDAVLSAVGPGAAVIVGAARSFLEALPQVGVSRLVVVGGSGSLEIRPGSLFIDAPNFPKEYLAQARAGLEALKIYQENQIIDWTVVSPPIWITPGKRTGKFRLGSDQLLFDSGGESRISAEDFGAAFLNEVQNPRHIHRRFTVAY